MWAITAKQLQLAARKQTRLVTVLQWPVVRLPPGPMAWHRAQLQRGPAHVFGAAVVDGEAHHVGSFEGEGALVACGGPGAEPAVDSSATGDTGSCRAVAFNLPGTAPASHDSQTCCTGGMCGAVLQWRHTEVAAKHAGCSSSSVCAFLRPRRAPELRQGSRIVCPMKSGESAMAGVSTAQRTVDGSSHQPPQSAPTAAGAGSGGQ